MVYLKNILIPRCLGLEAFEDLRKCQLHYFVNASKVAYGAVCYIGTITRNDVVCSLAMSKSHLVPKDEMSISRLELMAAVTAVRMDLMLKRDLGIESQSSIFWTDSSIVLLSLRNERKRFLLFVHRRLAMIARHTSVSSWNHVPSELNPADLLSRGCRADKLTSNSLWLTGPDFLKCEPSDWPNRFTNRTLTDSDVESFDKRTVNSLFVSEHISAMDQLITYFSSFYKLKKAAAWLVRFKQFLSTSKSNRPISRSYLTLRELQNVELNLIKYEQRQTFGELLKRIPTSAHSEHCLPKNSLNKLNPILVNGVLRVGGRLENAPIAFNARHPIIMPHVSHLTNLIVKHCHEAVSHGGINMTMNLVAQRFWAVKCTSVVRRVIKDCIRCRRKFAKPQEQVMADLPFARLQLNTHPFACTGVDYFGPLMIQIKRSKVKRYGCLFTCLTSRAIHLEVAIDLTSDAFIDVLRRFLCRRGPVNHMFSDNGTYLVGAVKILRECINEWNQQQIQDFLLKRGIQWTFMPPTASHMGEAWERQIRSVRRMLISIADDQCLSDDQLHTFLLEAESIMNSRPLIPITLDVDSHEALTPNHLLKLYPAVEFPPTLTTKNDCYARSRWRHVQYLADEFWRRFSKEYLHKITTRQKWHKKKPNLKPDDVVLICDETSPRVQWNLGRVITVHPDEHG